MARLFCNRRKYGHVIQDHIHDVLHWLPVSFRIEYKLCLLVFLSLHGAAPEYLRYYEFIHFQAMATITWEDWSLCDEDEDTLRRPCFLWRRSSKCWTVPLPAIRLAESVDSFKARLKIHLFPSLTRVYDNNGRHPRQEIGFGILQLKYSNSYPI